MTRRWPCFVVTTLGCLLTLATSASAEEPSQERANAIREQARAAAERAREQAVRVNLRWLLWSEETVMVAEVPHLRVLWTLLQVENKEQACEEARSARLADARTLGYAVNDREHVFAHPTRMVRYLCLPDTVDPRWPQGK